MPMRAGNAVHDTDNHRCRLHPGPRRLPRAPLPLLNRSTPHHLLQSRCWLDLPRRRRILLPDLGPALLLASSPTSGRRTPPRAHLLTEYGVG
ncbi:hypothetical protein PVAP13_8NG138604 [Panicum virgatum]|uniref:Uncharacterized protein n=1 Tax=Panicum virgatum TaxID=38727 RepID=A0A8T0PB80_PANVG|nr:hypothetical protein PVAP13_8NG138604 [Panicum virgatum]